MLLAKAITPYPITAFTGRELVRYEWRQVPAGCEMEAKRLSDAGQVELKEAGELTAKNEPAESANDGGDSSPVLVVDLDGLTIIELKSMAKEAGITVGRKSKAELIDALKDD